jgi:hypothetical protein
MGTAATFTTTIAQAKKTATGVVVPDEIVTQLGAGKRPPVQVTLNGHRYLSSIASMGGVFMISLSAENRTAAGVAGGDEVEVTVQVDDQPRTIEVPADLAAVLAGQPAVKQAFDALSYSNQRRHVLAVEGAKTDATRRRRIDKVVAELGGAPAPA